MLDTHQFIAKILTKGEKVSDSHPSLAFFPVVILQIAYLLMRSQWVVLLSAETFVTREVITFCCQGKASKKLTIRKALEFLKINVVSI